MAEGKKMRNVAAASVAAAVLAGCGEVTAPEVRPVDEAALMQSLATLQGTVQTGTTSVTLQQQAFSSFYHS